MVAFIDGILAVAYVVLAIHHVKQLLTFVK